MYTKKNIIIIIPSALNDPSHPIHNIIISIISTVLLRSSIIMCGGIMMKQWKREKQHSRKET